MAMIVCPDCGSAVPDTAAECPACGRTMAPAQPHPSPAIPERPAYGQPAPPYAGSGQPYGGPGPQYAGHGQPHAGYGPQYGPGSPYAGPGAQYAPAGPYYAAAVDPLAQHRQTVQIGYVLLAASFVFGPLYIVSAILGYTRRDAVRGTWLESHCNWLVDTFLVSLAIFGVGLFGFLVSMVTFFPIGFLFLMFLGFGGLAWLVYRTVRGWMLFGEGKPAAGIVSPPRW